MIWRVFLKQIGGKLYPKKTKQKKLIKSLNFRMLTEGTTTQTAASFSTASEESDFGKVYLNNMDEKSFNSDFNGQIEKMISNSKTAFYTINDMMAGKREYRNCDVSK